jgi:adenine-specific DNA-methyltransferase
MARINDLIRQLEAKDPALANEISREMRALSERRAFGLNFERHTPEQVELPGRPVRKGDKVHILSPRGELPEKENERIWMVDSISTGKAKVANLIAQDDPDQTSEMGLEDLIVVAEFRDPIYPGLVSTGKVERGGDKPSHTVINGENFHALEALLFTHRGKVDAIYIDPPYNTGARDWKYNNDYVEGDDLYRHSKWLAFMERRLKVARELLNPEESVLLVTIDEKEFLRLGLLLEQTFFGQRIQMVSLNINGAAVARTNAFGRTDEYMFVVYFGEAGPTPQVLGSDWTNRKGVTHLGEIRWDRLIRSGTNTERSHSPGCFYPIYIDPNGPVIREIGDPLPKGTSSAPHLGEGLHAVLPIRSNGSEGVWQMSADQCRSRLAQGRVRIGGNPERGFTLYYLKDGEYKKIVDGIYPVEGYRPDGSAITEKISTGITTTVPGTQWRVDAHDASHYGSRLLLKFLPDRKFPFPKSLYAVEDSLRFFVGDKPNAVIVDFFSGSGTTAHAVMRLNRSDGGCRTSISVTNNEVSADEQKELRRLGFRAGDAEWESLGICEYITKPRIRAAVLGVASDGESVRGDYKFNEEFPMADGFEENVEFFTLTYEAPMRVQSNREFSRIAPFLWLRAGSHGRRIDSLSNGWDVADAYGVLEDLDRTDEFLEAMNSAPAARIAYIVTDEDRLFEAVTRDLPNGVEPVRLYQSYFSNFEIDAMRGVR